ncbi:MAG: hypothetical protein Q8O22_04240 [Candidatus Omnitrophota bacterium]|nr:hypothetical protein [Candidatus Omnitrophota bacterium]
MIKRIFAITVLFLLARGLLCAADEPLPVKKLLVFFSPSCHKCMEIKTELLPQIAIEFAGRVEIEELDNSDIENYKLLLGLREKYQKGLEIVVPVFYFEGNFLNGRQVNAQNLRWLINRAGTSSAGSSLEPVDLTERFRAFKPLAVVGAGLIDGINPCAFTVIVFFISYLALQGYKKRELIVVGSTFIFAVFLTYLLLGLGIFNFLYYLKGFWLAARAINIGIGVFSIALGIAAVYDIIKFKKTGSADGLLLQLPQSIKNRIHHVIGLHYRKTGGDQPKKNVLWDLVISAFICGFLISLLEAVCTGQTYLPTIAFILKASPLKLQAFGYLVLYNLMFVAPLSAIFALALTGVTSEDFGRFLKERMIAVKVLMGLLFFGLGIFLLWRYAG